MTVPIDRAFSIDPGFSIDTVPPGTWIRFADHFPHALTPAYLDLYTRTFEEEQAAMFETMGVPFGGLSVIVVDGHLYLGPRPLVGRASAGLPPKPILWAATRLHPAFRARRATARRVLRQRPWLDAVHHWRHELEPLWLQANAALQDEAALTGDDAALAGHLGRCLANAEEGYRQHFRLHGPDLLSTGLLLARAADWGITTTEVFAVLAGSSPASRGLDPDLSLVRAIVAQHGAEPRDLDELRAIHPTIDAPLDRYLRRHGWRLVTSYDLDGRCLIEMPALIANLARPVDASPPVLPDVDAGALRARVPEREQDEFDRLLTDARFTYGLRDANGGVTGAWPVGLLRRAILAIGDRLVDRGRLAEREHAVELTIDELVASLLDGRGPDADTAAERAHARRVASHRQPPPMLGSPMPGDDVIGVFPKPLDLMVRAQLAIAAGASRHGGAPATGLGLGTRAVIGRACVARQATDALERLVPGDILVTASTTPSFNAALSIAGGLVVEEGGYLSHAAVMARELDLPTLIGVDRATVTIPDGSIIELDPRNGLVRVLDEMRPAV